MKLNSLQKVFFSYYIFLTIFWLALFTQHITSGFYNYLYSFLFGLIPLVAGVIALIKSKEWGRLSSAIGKAVFFVGLGIFLWGFGELIWSYYNFFLGIEAPYPSLADLGFAPSIFFYGLGTFYLSKATGAKFVLRNKHAKLLVVITLVLTTVISYYILVVIAREGIVIQAGETVMKALFDTIYPFGDFLGLAIGTIVSGLSFKYLGGKYKTDIWSILLGLGVMFVADSVFSYTTTVNTYYNGNFGDYLLTTGVFLLSFGILGFCQLKDH